MKSYWIKYVPSLHQSHSIGIQLGTIQQMTNVGLFPLIGPPLDPGSRGRVRNGAHDSL
jgi:hypothetical protein